VSNVLALYFLNGRNRLGGIWGFRGVDTILGMGGIEADMALEAPLFHGGAGGGDRADL
jgi:hypothetical protein